MVRCRDPNPHPARHARARGSIMPSLATTTASGRWSAHSVSPSSLALRGSILARRGAVARRYCELLRDTSGLILPATDIPGQRLSWFVFVVRLADAGTGVAQALNIAETLGCNPNRLLVLDEPAANLHQPGNALCFRVCADGLIRVS